VSTDDAPATIRLRDNGQTLVLEYAQRPRQTLPAEYLRVHSPSAEVKGHFGEGGELPIGKESVRIAQIEKSGNYAIRLHFDDGHDSGIYTWEYLWQLAREQEQRWQAYLIELRKRGESRDPGVQVVRLIDPKNT